MNKMKMNFFKAGLNACIAVAVFCILAFLPLTADAAAVTDPPDFVVDDSWTTQSGGENVDYTIGSNTYTYEFGATAFKTIDLAVGAATTAGGGSIGIAEGSYTLAATLTITEDISLEGQNVSNPSAVTISPSASMDKMISFEEATDGAFSNAALKNVTIDGLSFDVKNAVYSDAAITVTDVEISNISHATFDAALPDVGLYLTDNATVTGVTMSNMGRYGIIAVGGITVGITDYTYTGKGTGEVLDYGIEVRSGAVCNVASAAIASCAGVVTGGATSAAIVASTDGGSGTALTVTTSTLTGNAINVAVGYTDADTTSVSIDSSTLIPATGGLNIDTYSNQLFVCPDNKWGFDVYADVLATLNIAGTGDVDVIPYVMSNDQSSDLYLNSITTSSGTLTPSFTPLTLAYNVQVPFDVDSITVTPTTIESTSAVTVNGTTVASGAASSPISLNEGNNTIQVIVDDSTTTTTYTLTVYREHSYLLSALSMTDGTNPLTLTPTFDSNVFAYSVFVPDTVSSVAITATPEDTDPSVSVDGDGTQLLLDEPNDTPLTVTVTSRDSKTKDYVITVSYESDDASLSDLKLNGTTVTGFTPGTLTYTEEVPYSVTSAELTVTPANAHAGYTINSAAPESDYTLGVGDNNFVIRVTAQDGTTFETYNLTVTRDDATTNNANLSALTVDGTSVTGFNPATTAYALDVSAATASVVIAATPEDAGATVSGTGTVSLDYGINTKTVSVESSDTTTTKNYVLTITRAGAADATLSDLTIDGATISGFSSAVTSYTYYADEADTSVVIAATPTIAGASVTGTGTKVISAGNNNFNVVVTAVDGTTTKTYAIKVVHPGSSSADLQSITIDGTLISGFDYQTYQYIIEKPAGTSSVAIAATALDSGAVITGTGTKSLSPGGNDFTITVVSQNGSVTKKYLLTIFSGYKKDATLKNIKIDGTTISGFSASDTSYTINMTNSVTKFSLTAETTDSYASVSGIGTKWLVVGTNVFYLNVTADDDATKKTYKLYVIRAASSSSSSGSSSSGSSSSGSSSSGSSSSGSSSSSSGSSGDDDEDDADVDSGVPMDVVEDILLKDAEKTQDGKNMMLMIDDDAFYQAILDVLSRENVEEGDGTNGIDAIPYISFPKANSLDDEESVAVGFSGEALKEAFKQGVGLIVTLDNYQIKLPPDAFDPESLDDNVVRYFISKRLPGKDETKDILEKVPSGKEVFYTTEITMQYETADKTEAITAFDKPMEVSILLDNDISKIIEEADSLDDISLYVYDENYGQLLSLEFDYNAAGNTMTFDTRRTGKFMFAKKTARETETVTEPVETEAEKERKPFPTFMVLISIAAVVLLGAIIFLLVRRFGGGDGSDDHNITI